MKTTNVLMTSDLDALMLPEREALGFIDISTVVPINLAIAINAGNLGGMTLANATAGMAVGVTQS